MMWPSGAWPLCTRRETAFRQELRGGHSPTAEAAEYPRKSKKQSEHQHEPFLVKSRLRIVELKSFAAISVRHVRIRRDVSLCISLVQMLKHKHPVKKQDDLFTT